MQTVNTRMLRDRLEKARETQSVSKETLDMMLRALDELALSRAMLKDAADALTLDRSGMAYALAKIRGVIKSRMWVTESRGCYSWDDDRYKEEAGIALREADEIAKQSFRASLNLVFPVIRAIDRDLAGVDVPSLERLYKILTLIPQT